MKTLVILAIAMFSFMGRAHAEVPDVNKWNCPEVTRNSRYATEQCGRDGSWEKDTYLKVGGELVGVHEHRMTGDQLKYYNALKLNSGEWKEFVLTSDGWLYSRLEPDGSLTLILMDNGVFLAERNVPKIK